MKSRPTVVVTAAFLLALAVVAPRAGASHVATPVQLRPDIVSASSLVTSSPPTLAQCLASSDNRSRCYTPAQIQAAYDVAPLFAKKIEGQGQTIVIVDAFGSPTIKADLATFDATFHLPAPPSLKIITPDGPIAPYKPFATDRTGWAFETTLDVEWAHVLAPKANLLLVETPTDEVEGTSGFPDIVKAETYVIRHKLGAIISQSFDASEVSFRSLSQITPLRTAYTAAAAAGVSVLAGTGDWGATNYHADGVTLNTTPAIGWPASDPLVTAVGGTTLTLDQSGARLSPDVVWNDDTLTNSPDKGATGGGHSIYFARPSYQNSVSAVAGSTRSVPDISLSASCYGAVDLYESFVGEGSEPGWHTECGTSEATPLLAGILALADQEAKHGLGLINPALYALAGVTPNGLVDVTSGTNTVSFHNAAHQLVTVTGYDAGPGYDLASGLGTLDAALFVPALVKESAALAH